MAEIFAADADLLEMTEAYAERNPTADRRAVGKVLQKVGKILNNQVGVIELAEDLDIETVTEIFIRVNSAGAELSQADFAMSKIAANTSYGGNLLRKVIDYFCHLAVAPDFLARIEKGDKVFAASEYEEAITEESFGRLKNGILAFINKTHFDRITMILRSAGFVTSALIGAQNNVNFAYILYLRGRAENVKATCA